MELVRQKNVATIITFPIVDADGDFVSGATALDSEIDAWTDGAAPDGFTDCTNEATEIGSTGVYYLSLTQTEMNNDYIVIQTKTSSSGAKTQMILINTMVGDPLNRATTDDGGTINVTAGAIDTVTTVTAVTTVNGLAANVITAAATAADFTNEVWAKACTEPTAVVSAAPTAIAALSWLTTLSRNTITQTATTQTVMADDGATPIAASTVSDDGVTFTRGEFA